MAAVVEILKRTKNLSLYQIIALITFDSSYPTGGEAITPAQFGLQSIDFVSLANSGVYSFEYDYINNKVKAYTTLAAAATAEVANATNLAAVTIRAVVHGT